jgi:hypothetical protein
VCDQPCIGGVNLISYFSNPLQPFSDVYRNVSIAYEQLALSCGKVPLVKSLIVLRVRFINGMVHENEPSRLCHTDHLFNSEYGIVAVINAIAGMNEIKSIESKLWNKLFGKSNLGSQGRRQSVSDEE